MNRFSIWLAVLLMLPVCSARAAELPTFKNLDYVSTPGYQPVQGLFQGTYLYGAVMGSSYPTLYAYDIHDPFNPQQVKSISLSYDAFFCANDIVLSGNRIYVAGVSAVNKSLVARICEYDISNPASPSPSRTSTISSVGDLTTILIDGQTAYATNAGRVLKFELATMNLQYMTQDCGDLFNKLAVSGRALYALGTQKGLSVYDIETSGSLRHARNIPVSGGRALIVNANRLYVGTGDSFMVFNVDQPLTPTLMTTYSVPTPVREMACRDNLLFLTFYSSYIPLQVFDVSDAGHIAKVAQMDVPQSLYWGGNIDVSIDPASDLIYCDGYLLRLAVGNLVKVSNIAPAGSRVDFLGSRNKFYTDQSDEFTSASLPKEWMNCGYIQTVGTDKNATAMDYLRFAISKPATVYVAYDERAESLPNWLSGWQRTPMLLSASNQNWRLYAHAYPAGEVVLGGNLASGASPAGLNMYIVLVVSGDLNAAGKWAMYR